MAPYSTWAVVQRHKRSVPAQVPVLRDLERVCYEGYGPGGTAVLIECETADRQRSGVLIRRLFAAHGGHLGAPGAVAYLFHPVGLISYPPGTDCDRVGEAALAAGAEDVVAGVDGGIEVLTDPIDLETVRMLLVANGLPPGSAQLTRRACTSVPLSGECARQMLLLLRALERVADVRDVYSNVALPDEIVAEA